jgi:hypothetical protein
MGKDLLGTGAGLLVASLVSALVLSAVDPFWAEEHVALLTFWGWLQQALLVLGAALVGAGMVVMRLAPPHALKREAASQPSGDWFA